jgi:hypothetical protein
MQEKCATTSRRKRNERSRFCLEEKAFKKKKKKKNRERQIPNACSREQSEVRLVVTGGSPR